MLLGMEVGLGLRDIVLDGDPASLPLKGHSAPNFRLMSVVAGLTKMSLGMEVGLGPDDIVLDGDPVPPEKRAHPSPPNFWPMSIVAKRMDG